METTKREIEYLARNKFGATARVFEHTSRNDGVDEKWFVLAVDGTIVGFRRELVELPLLIQRGQSQSGDCD